MYFPRTSRILTDEADRESNEREPHQLLSAPNSFHAHHPHPLKLDAEDEGCDGTRSSDRTRPATTAEDGTELGPPARRTLE